MQDKSFQSNIKNDPLCYIGIMSRTLLRERPSQGERLLELRKAANLSQAELAELVGETQRNIAYWEQSDKPPRSDVLPKLAEVLGVRMEDLVNTVTTPKRRGGPVGKVRQIFEEVSQLPRKEQNKIVETVSALVNQYKRNGLETGRWAK